MKTTYSIEIKEPCHENWNKMLPNEKGKFCKMCQKNVHDLSGFSDSQLLQFVSSNKNLCARVTSDQLNTPLVQKTKLFHFKTTYAKIASVIALFLISEKSYAQGSVMLKDSMHVVDIKDITDKNKNKVDESNFILGIIIDNEEDPAPFCSIKILETHHETYSDAEGFFSIKDEFVSNLDSISIAITYDDEKKFEFKIKKEDYNDTFLELKLSLPYETKKEIHTLGYTTIKKKKWWQFWKKQ